MSALDLNLVRHARHVSDCPVCAPAENRRQHWNGEGERPLEHAYCATGESLWRAYLMPPFKSQVQNAKRLRARYEMRKSTLLCIDCGLESAHAPHATCAICLVTGNERRRLGLAARRAERRERGMCHKCNRVRVKPPYARCALCRKKALDRYHGKVTKGTCKMCRHAPSDEGKKSCGPCRQKEADRKYASYLPKRRRSKRRTNRLTSPETM